MSKLLVRFHPKALKEAENSQSWYAQRNFIAAKGFAIELAHAIDMVSEEPNRWPKFHSDTRRYVFPKYPFSLIYRIKEDVIEVLAIAHHKKRPGYWVER